MITHEKIDTWITYLLISDIPQGREQLFDGTSYCCLGVYAEKVCGIDLLEELDPKEYTLDFPGQYGGTSGDTLMPQQLMPMLFDISEDWRDHLAEMNDDGSSFAEIADYIDAHRDRLVNGIEPPGDDW